MSVVDWGEGASWASVLTLNDKAGSGKVDIDIDVYLASVMRSRRIC